jgi:hypothetical protein
MPYIEINVIHNNMKLEDTGFFAGLDSIPKITALSRDLKVNTHFQGLSPLSDTIVITYDELKFGIVIFFENKGTFQIEVMWYNCVSINIIGDIKILNTNTQKILTTFLDYAKIPFEEKLKKVMEK